MHVYLFAWMVMCILRFIRDLLAVVLKMSFPTFVLVFLYISSWSLCVWRAPVLLHM